MPTVNFRTLDGGVREVRAQSGATVMNVAVQNGVPGIVAECGGSASCSTCHVYVDEADCARIPDVSDLEDDMLDGVASERLSNSRLSCQLVLTDALDRLAVTIPEEQI